jgi:hypothetical protein
MDLTRNSALDPVADGLLVDLEDLRDLCDCEELIVGGEHETVVRLVGTGAAVGARERAALGLAAVHEVVVAGQVAAVLDERPEEVDQLLENLCASGWLVRDRSASERADFFRVTSAGLDAVGSRLPSPRFGSRQREAIAAAWIWLGARRGAAFGPVDRVLSAREMLAEDQEDGPDSPFFVEPGEFGGRLGVRYPDLVAFSGPHRLAVEVLLALPPRRQLEAVLRAYAADVRIAMVRFFVVDPRLAQVIESIIASLDLSPMAAVQLIQSWWRSQVTAG